MLIRTGSPGRPPRLGEPGIMLAHLSDGEGKQNQKKHNKRSNGSNADRLGVLELYVVIVTPLTPAQLLQSVDANGYFSVENRRPWQQPLFVWH